MRVGRLQPVTEKFIARGHSDGVLITVAGLTLNKWPILSANYTIGTKT